jgi:DNA replication and repair protein RecF
MDRLTQLTHLSLVNFRNLLHLDLELPGGIIVFFGANAQGKTSLLEAIYLLAIARSFKAENERELVNFRSAAELGQALVGGVIERQEGRIQVYVGYQCVSAPISTQVGGDKWGYSVRKQIRVSRVRRTATDLVGTVNAVLFSAEDIQLVYGPPSRRRRYLDILISQIDPLYLRGLQRYQRVMHQRNRLLRVLREGRANADELEFWDNELVREGAALTLRRQEATTFLSSACAQQYRELIDDGEELWMEYRPSVQLGGDIPEIEWEFRQVLLAFRDRELATCMTVIGPHRDDIRLSIGGIDMGTFASRGQARTVALTLRLAEAAYLAVTRGEGPIVLLDDVLSEMDVGRRKKVLEKVAEYQQVLITTTDLHLVRDFLGRRATYFHVSDGEVSCLIDLPDTADS